MHNDLEMMAVACALARYLCANPMASDTPEGIHRWWLGPEDRSMDTLVRALAYMKAQGLIEEQVAVDGRARYRRSTKDDELKHMLEQCASMPALRH